MLKSKRHIIIQSELIFLTYIFRVCYYDTICSNRKELKKCSKNNEKYVIYYIFYHFLQYIEIQNRKSPGTATLKYAVPRDFYKRLIRLVFYLKDRKTFAYLHKIAVARKQGIGTHTA